MLPPSSTSFDFQLTTQRYIPEEITLYFFHVFTDRVARQPGRICTPHICSPHGRKQTETCGLQVIFARRLSPVLPTQNQICIYGIV
jgi:hypothetical protein